MRIAIWIAAAATVVAAPAGAQFKQAAETGATVSARATLATNDPAGCFAFSPDGATVWVTAGRRAQRYEVATGKLLVTVDFHSTDNPDWHLAAITSCAVSHDGARIATGDRDGQVRIWDAATGKVAGKLIAGTQGHPVSSLSLSGDDRTLLSATRDQTIATWDMATYKKKATLETKDAGIFESARYSPDGRVIAALHNAGRVRLYSAGSGSPAGSFAVTTEGDTGHHGITFSPDGKRLAVGGTKGARVYDFPSGKLRLTLPHEGWVTGVAFSHDGKRIATACHDKTARLWDAQTGKPKATFEGHPGIVNTIAFSRDGKTLATGAEAEARLWDVPQ